MEVDVGGVGKDNHKAPRHHVITQELLCNKEKAGWGAEGQEIHSQLPLGRVAESRTKVLGVSAENNT
jgi:hypothetical protein